MCIIDDIPYAIIVNDSFNGFVNRDGVIDDNIMKSQAFLNLPYEIEIVNKTDTETYACGYLKSDNSLECKVAYSTNEYLYYTSSNYKILPVDPNQSLSDSAVSKFKDLMSKFATSIHVS